MNDDFDLQRFAEIPDPFAGVASPPPEGMVRNGLPPSRTRSNVRALRAVAMLSAVIIDSVWVGFIRHRPDLRFLSPGQIALGLSIPLAAMALALAAVSRHGAFGLGEPKKRLIVLLIASPALFAAATALTAGPDAGDGRFWYHAALCLLVTSILAGVPLGVGAFVFRRAFATMARWRMAAVGVASGAAAAATMSLGCPVSSAGHVLVGHGAMMLLAGLVGALVGERVARA